MLVFIMYAAPISSERLGVINIERCRVYSDEILLAYDAVDELRSPCCTFRHNPCSCDMGHNLNEYLVPWSGWHGKKLIRQVKSARFYPPHLHVGLEVRTLRLCLRS